MTNEEMRNDVLAAAKVEGLEVFGYRYQAISEPVLAVKGDSDEMDAFYCQLDEETRDKVKEHKLGMAVVLYFPSIDFETAPEKEEATAQETPKMVREYVVCNDGNTRFESYIDFDGTAEDFEKKAKSIATENFTNYRDSRCAPCISGENFFYRYGFGTVAL